MELCRGKGSTHLREQDIITRMEGLWDRKVLLLIVHINEYRIQPICLELG